MKNILMCAMALTSLLAFSCKTTKSGNEQAALQKAIWYNWTGGIAGVGGTNYEISFEIPDGASYEVLSATIDGNTIPVDKVSKAENVLTVFLSENRSANQRSKDQPMINNPTPNYRTENPKSGQIELLFNDKSVTIEVTNFEKTDSKNYK
ncbi:hypothetical protein [Marinoscillum furvescens]|uniref:Lipoprotein n=1 Tax=Marinoscillum furvescens DSM 4134 TaxID=1122208 RepID=A0A3D9L6U6_MARFU|nr:hypothetical protein [Marinoscillum furvescens]REE02068.1 hypothetical protein C7460_10288 [Marinoscillum furvescens DSM 4134]